MDYEPQRLDGENVGYTAPGSRFTVYAVFLISTDKLNFLRQSAVTTGGPMELDIRRARLHLAVESNLSSGY